MVMTTNQNLDNLCVCVVRGEGPKGVGVVADQPNIEAFDLDMNRDHIEQYLPIWRTNICLHLKWG